MSLLNFILQDKLILITISAVGALLVLGVLLMVISSVRSLIQRLADAAEDDIDAVTEMAADEEDSDLPLPAPAAAAPTPPPAPAAPEPEANDMQKILTSVFSDEENTSRRRVLYESVQPVEVHALASLAQKTAAKLGVKAKTSS